MLPAITDADEYVRTRDGWHALAERVLAPALHSATGHIGLRVDDGITTPRFGADDRRVRAWVGNLEDHTAGGGRTTSLTTLGAAADFVGVDACADTGVYTPTTTTDPTAWIAGDDHSATALVAWFAFGDTILRAWAAAHADESPSTVQLWPEHFDLGTDLGPDDGRRANYGASPGDADHPLPYLYVGPWDQSVEGALWNATGFKGAELTHADLVAAPDQLAVAAEFLATRLAGLGSPN